MKTRQALVSLHRYVGLATALFLLIAGLSGALLAWNDELEALISPDLFVVDQGLSHAEPLDPVVLREQVARHHPHATVRFMPLSHEPGRSVKFTLEDGTDPVTGRTVEPANDEVFVDPFTGRVLGERRWGDLSQGRHNLMPFVYRLHYALAMGSVGRYTMGIIALFWTVDCLIGLYLTFPMPLSTARRGKASSTTPTSWLRRWAPAWSIRWHAGWYKLNFDLHRASGLWPWALLLVLAWSSVAFNLTEVYRPVMHGLLPHQARAQKLPATSLASAASAIPSTATLTPQAWRQALDTARQHAHTLRWQVRQEAFLVHDARSDTFTYRVRTAADVNEHQGRTELVLDRATGALRGTFLPTGQAAGDTVYTWITSLHMAAMWGWPFKLLISLVGLAVGLLSVTGVVVWHKKRQSRRKSAANRALRRAAASHAAAGSGPRSGSRPAH